jgi:hypothetical protein
VHIDEHGEFGATCKPHAVARKQAAKTRIDLTAAAILNVGKEEGECP